MSLSTAARSISSGHPATKPLDYYARYDDFLSHHRLRPRNILEIGTFEGESAKILALAFPDSRIVTVDLKKREIDFSAFPGIHYEIADQGDPESLRALVDRHFKDGIDLVIEDASHIGQLSKTTFQTLFPAVVPGGAYFVEDWGTGYWDSAIDGRSVDERQLILHGAPRQVGAASSRHQWHRRLVRRAGRFFGIKHTRLPTHDHGMVGFVKSLVDLTHEDAIRTSPAAPQKYSPRLRVLEFGRGVCMALKA